MTAIISIVMPAFNVDKYIKDAIECILKQTFIDWELIIINDGSTDNTWNIISTFHDPRIKAYNYNTNNGAGWVSHQALKLINSTFIARMDADDLCEPDRFEKQYNFLIEHPEVTVVRSYARIFSEDSEVKKTAFYQNKITISSARANQELSREEISEKMYWYQCMISPTALMRTEAVKEIGYSPLFRMGEDYNLLYNLNKKHYIIDTIPEYLYHYRVVKGSATYVHNLDHAEVNYMIKKQEINNLFKNPSVFIWGTGGLAKKLALLLTTDNYKISGYLDFNNNSGDTSLALFNYKNLSPKKHKIIIAATPVREKIVSELYARGFEHIKDFIVFQ